MNALRTLFHTSRAFRTCLVALTGLLLAGLLGSASLAGMKPAPVHGLGAALALIAQQRAARAQVNLNTGMNGLRQAAKGRALTGRAMLRPGALLKPRVNTGTVVPISSAVQTYDVFNPPPGFRPLIGFGDPADPNNNSSNPPVYISSLTPTNLTPIWSRDESFIIFSSNRTRFGAVRTDGRFHLWAISVNGGEAFQITTSVGPAGGGEFFPALSSSNNGLAYTSDAQSFGVQNLYVIADPNFSFSALVAMNNAQPLVDVSNTTATQSLTIRGNSAGGLPLTGFDQVERPTFSPADSQLIVFSAHSVTGTNAGHNHVYFLYTSNLGFDPNNLSFPGKLTDGPAEDTDPTYSPDGQFIAFSSTASNVRRQPNGMNSFGPNPPSAQQDPNQSQSITSFTNPAQPNTVRSIFLISGGTSGSGAGFGSVPPQFQSIGGRVTLAGNDDYGPSFNSFANINQFTNPTGDLGYLSFARRTAAAATHEIYYLQVVRGVSSPNTETLQTETAAGGANAAIQLNTDDPSGAFEHAYPSWSPFLSLFSLTYSSNRTVTYNDPATSFPRETAASVAQGGTVSGPDAQSGYTVGSNYAGILISQLLNLDPPTLLRFSANEVLHIQAAGTTDASGNSADPVNGTPNKLAASAGQKIVATVRLSDRESGIDDTGGPNGGPRVYVQIKDPDSKYQDSQNVEHKVFARDAQFNGQANQPINEVNSGRANNRLGNYTPDGYGDFPGFTPPALQKYTYPSYGPTVSTPNDVFPVSPRGAHGGHWFAPDNDNPAVTYIFVGKNGGGTNPQATPQQLPGGDPGLFIPLGPEYEAQVLNPQFATSGNANAGGGDATPGVSAATASDYTAPFWLAGVDDQGAFSGGVYSTNTGASNLPRNGGVTQTNGVVQTDRPTANYTTPAGGGTVRRPAEWLQLQRVPTALQDNLGGVLYTVTFTTPTSGSDFFLDVIAYDKAAFPNIPNTGFTGRRTDWRIYDNVGGFSTNQSVGNNDILVVSDYALGQKFAATTFGGRNSNLNLVPKIFGTESYLTDVDVNILPDSVYGGMPDPQNVSPASYVFFPVIQGFAQFVGITRNGLGVRSFQDDQVDDGTTADGFTNSQSQRYSIWRILSRGPVPQTVLKSYLPTPVQQPAVQDPADTAFQNIPAATLLEAPRCVIWLSPYTGDVLEDPGAMDDPGTVGQVGVSAARQSTTSILTNFVQSGGRLCVTGQDIGSTLTLGGTTNNTPGTGGATNFLPDVLNASLASPGTDVRVLAGTQNRIAGNSQYDGAYIGNFSSYPTMTGKLPGPFFNQIPNYPYQDNLVIGNPDFSDSGLSQVPPRQLPTGASIQGQPDTLTPLNGATTGLTYGAAGPAALVFHDDPYKPTSDGSLPKLPNGGTGSRVVYAGFGLEALSQDYYSSDCPHPAPTMNPDVHAMIPPVAPRNPRTEILHNIVNYLRTGRVTGTITQTSGTGQGGGLGIDGATVYLRPVTGTAPPNRPVFSALTANGGRFTIFGVEPGTYTVVAYKPGFNRAVSNSNDTFVVEGDITAKRSATLTLTPLPPGSIAGAVQDTAGNLINGATVTFTSQDNSITRTVTTANGSVAGNAAENYFLQNVPVTTYTGTATGPLNAQGLPEYTAATAPDAPNNGGIAVPAGSTVQPVNFTLTAILATISGRIFNATIGDTAVGGASVAGATVTLTDSTGAPVAGVAAVRAGADGTYTFTNVPATQTATTYTITATKAGFAATGNTTTAAVMLGSVVTGKDIGLTPIAPGALTGRVTDAAGPVVGALVNFTSADGTVTLGPATTDGSGTYTIAAVPPGTYNGTATGPINPNGRPTETGGVVTAVVVASAPPATTANFTVTLVQPSLSGTVTNAATQAPLANAVITITDSGTTSTRGTVVKTTTTIANGTYSSGTLAPGTYTVTATLVGFANGTVPSQTIYFGDALTGQNIALTAVLPGSITGQVTDQSNGAGISGATVTFKSTDGTVTLGPATTDANGNYVIPPPPASTGPAGSYIGTAVGPANANGSPEFNSSAPQSATIPPGGTAVVNFALTEIAASVAGVVSDNQTGAPISGATVTLTDSTGAVLFTATTGATGAYSFAPVPAGQTAASFSIAAAVPGYFPGALSVSLSLGDQLTGLNLGLDEQGTVTGLVIDSSTGLPLSNVSLTLTDTTTRATPANLTPSPLVTTAGTTVGPDGKTSNYTATFVLTPGHSYSVSAAKATYNPATAVTVTPAPLTLGQIGRANLQLTSSIGILGGLVTDATTGASVGGATITVTNAAGTVLATFTTNGSVSPAPDGKAQGLNYSGQVTQGTYTVTLTFGNRTPVKQTVTIVGGQFNRLDFTGTSGTPPIFTFAAGLQFLSTPYDYSALGFDGLFGSLNTAAAGTTPNGNRSHVAVWDPTVGQYALDPNAPADTLRLGVGYWVFLKNAVPVTQQGTTPTAAYVPVALHPSWNQIGVPNRTGVPVSSLMFDNGAGGMISFATAVSSQYHLVSPTLYSFDGVSYQPVTQSSVLQPWKAYWIKVFSNATIEIPTR